MNEQAPFDCLVLGLGPAGASFLRLAPRHLCLAALSLPMDPYGKPCGGLLAPDAQAELARQGLNLPLDVLVSPQIFAVHTIDLGTGQSRHYKRAYVNMNRALFDAWLCSLIPDTVSRFTGRARSISRTSSGIYQVEYIDTEGNAQRLFCKSIVGADGANSLVRRSLFPNKRPKGFVSIQQWFPHEESTPFYACIFDAATNPACSWAVSKNGALLFGGAFPSKDCRKRFEQQKDKLRALGWRLNKPLHTQACRVLCPGSSRDFCLGGDGAFLIGEAAGFISPSSLEGISYALRSAEALAAAFNTADPLSSYKRKTFSLRLKLLSKLLKRPFMYSPSLRTLILRLGLSALSLRDESLPTV